MVEEFENWIFDASRKTGDTGLVKTPYGWHVMYFVNRNEVIWKNTAKTALVNEAVDTWTSGILETYGSM